MTVNNERLIRNLSIILQRLSYFLFCLMYGVIAALPAVAGGQSLNNGMSRIEKSERCTFRHNGVFLFIGTKECFSKIPQIRMHGIWIVGLEKSFFIEQRIKGGKARKKHAAAIWLDINSSEAFSKAGLGFDGTERHFLISFLGRRSTNPGIYGHMGQYAGGAVVDKLLSIQSLKMTRQR